MRQPNDKWSFGTAKVLLVVIKYFTQVHRLKLLLQLGFIDGCKHDLGAHKHVKVFLVLRGEVKNDLGQIDPALVRCRLALNLVDRIEGEGDLMFSQAATEARDETLGLLTETNDFEVVRQ